MDSTYRIATLANGTEARIRLVSPHIAQGLSRRIDEAIPPKPQVPTKEIKSVDGHTEPAVVSEGDPEYERWKKDFVAWEVERERVEDTIAQDNMLRLVVYAVTGWRKALGPFLRLLRAIFHINWFWNIFGLGWRSTPPKKWQPDPITVVPDGMDDRDVYILDELISATMDYDIIKAAAFLSARAPLTQEEVGRQLDGF